MRARGPASSDPIVETASGKVRGKWVRRSSKEPRPTAVFKGIPFADPPTGALRFAPPRAREPWRGVLSAANFGPTPQRGARGITRIPEHSVPGEDTLSVNVWTPTLDSDAKLPVVVWIHGGGFVSGSAASPWYEGHAFARDGVVLVTLSYRLGFDGFGWIDDATPNRGVLDWVLALEWVRDHVMAFGGDPAKVTVAGQSAGGAATLTLLGTPAAQGLFHGVYAMSPAIADPSVSAAKSRSELLAKIAEVTPDLSGFSSLSEARILSLQPRVTEPHAPQLLGGLHGLLSAGLMIGPVVDGEIVADPVEIGVAQGVQAGVPLVVGTTDDELTDMFAPGGLLDHAPHRLVLRSIGATKEQADRWLADPGIAAINGAKTLVGRYATDAVFRRWVPRIASARAGSQEAGPTWTYRFAWHPDEPPHAAHCIDVPFVFDCLDDPEVAAVAGVAPPQELADAAHGALVSFATSGSPGWQPDVGAEGVSRVFDVPVREEVDAYASARALLDGPR